MPSPTQTADPVLVRTFEVEPGGRCRLRVPRAAVTLLAGTGARAEVTFTAASGTSPDAARALAKEIGVRYAGGVVRVEPHQPPQLDVHGWRALRKGQPSLRVRVALPASFGADVHVPGGTIEAHGLQGPVTLEATGGAIRTTNLRGRLDVRAHRCQETLIEDYDGPRLSVQARSSPLTVRGAVSDAMEIESTAGRLELETIAAPLQLTAHNGTTRVERLHGRLDAEVCGGQFDFAPGAGHGAHLHAPGSDVHLRFDDDAHLRLAAGHLLMDDLHGFDGERSRDQAEGLLGDGGALIEATAAGGTLRCT